jgi:Protein of unknown function (DUF2510)
VTDDTPAGEVPAAKRPAAKRPPAEKAEATAIPPVEAAPIIVAPAVAAAPAGWYPVAAGSAQQRWWDGTRWTDHVYDPAAAARGAAAAPVAVAAVRAAEGVKPGTVWFWLLVVGAPVLQLLELIPTSIWINSFLSSVGSDLQNPNAIVGAEFNAAYAVLLLCGFVVYAFCVVFAALDWRELKASGVPRPFHWAWSFLILVVGSPVVYVIGRTVVAKRRTGLGMAPLWVYIGLQVLAWIGSLAFGIYIAVQFVNLVNNSLSPAAGVF